jgi:predicted phage terminase large subunit-like protein
VFERSWLEHRYEWAHESHVTLEGGPTLPLSEIRKFATVDLAVSVKTSADYSVIAVFGIAPDGRLLLLDVDRARRAGPDQVPALKRAVQKWDLTSVWIEKSSMSLGVIQEAQRAGVPTRELIADKDKISRATLATTQLAPGRFLFPRSAPWLDDVLAEMLAFPNGQHDDVVDCIGYAARVAQTGLGQSFFMSLIESGWGNKLDDEDDEDYEPTEHERAMRGFMPENSFTRGGRLMSMGEIRHRRGYQW